MQTVRVWRIVFVALAWIFLACISVQVFIAGMATFSDSGKWELHKWFIRFFAILPLLMFLLTFPATMKGRLRWGSLGLFALIILQFLTIKWNTPEFAIATLHPVIAAILFWGTAVIAKSGSMTVKKMTKEGVFS